MEHLPPGPRLPSIWLLLLPLFALGFLIVAEYEQESAQWAHDAPVPSQLPPGAVQPFFTTPFLVFPDIPQWRTPPPLEQALIADIDAAQMSIDVAAFEYDLLTIADALVRAHQRGVVVRLALDREILDDPTDAYWAGIVEQAGIPITWEQTSAFLHSKFFVIDRHIVWMGSWNVSQNATYRNNESVLRIAIPAIAENYTAEFEQMFQQRFGQQKASASPFPVITIGTGQIENYFSPQDGIAHVLKQRLSLAEESIYFLAFSYTSREIAEVMIDRHHAGVRVEGVMELRNARGTGSQLTPLREAGITLLEDGNCYTMHHKLMIIDRRTVIVGSYNVTARAEEVNDENVIIIDDVGLASAFLEEFARVMTQAQAPTHCS